MRRRALFALLLTTVLSTVAGLAVDSPANAASSFHQIHNVGSDKCIRPVDGSVEAGVAIMQDLCDANDQSQFWFSDRIVRGDFDVVYRFVNQKSGLCLDARGGATNGTPIQQWPCNSITNELWLPNGSVAAHFDIISRVSGTQSHCLDVPNGDTASVALQLFRCNGTPAQKWDQVFVNP